MSRKTRTEAPAIVLVDSTEEDALSPKLRAQLNERDRLKKKVGAELTKLPSLRQVTTGYVRKIVKLAPTKADAAKILGITRVTLDRHLNA